MDVTKEEVAKLKFVSLVFVSETLSKLLDSAAIVYLHDEATGRWHDASAAEQGGTSETLSLIEAQHRANFELWHQEDLARNPTAFDAQIVEVKHAIDRINQRRNDLVEALDGMLLRAVPQQNDSSPLHSETPGLIVDRLSILALKIYHTAEEAERTSASAEHRVRNGHRLALLMRQRSDLAGCLDTLWQDVLAGRRHFRLYRQMKMYNDPELNPEVYRRKRL